jgi:hypothetical protein
MKTITRSDYYKLVGLHTVAIEHEKALKQILKAALSITAEQDDCGHTSDTIFGSRTVDELIELLDITVVEEPTP